MELTSNAPATCKPGSPYGAGDSGDSAGLKCRVFISGSSPQCQVTAELSIPRLNARKSFYIYLLGFERDFW